MVTTVTACGQTPPHEAVIQQKASQPTSMEGPPINWGNPIQGTTEASVDAAQQQMPFTLRQLPGRDGSPKILFTPGRAPSLRVVVLQYQKPSGLVDVFEGTAQISSSQLQGVIDHWVGLNGRKGTSGTATDVQVQGHPALMTTSANGTRSAIMWIEGKVEYQIMGPSLTKSDCVKFANQLS